MNRNIRNIVSGVSGVRVTSCIRWRLICSLLADPVSESRRLAELLNLWPAEVRRHECSDEFPLKKRLRNGWPG